MGEYQSGSDRTSKLYAQNDFTSSTENDGIESAITTIDAGDTLLKIDISQLWQGTFEVINNGSSNSLTYEIFLTKQFKSTIPDTDDTFWTTSLTDTSIWRPYITSVTLAADSLSDEHLWLGDDNFAAVQVTSASAGLSTTSS